MNPDELFRHLCVLLHLNRHEQLPREVLWRVSALKAVRTYARHQPDCAAVAAGSQAWARPCTCGLAGALSIGRRWERIWPRWQGGPPPEEVGQLLLELSGRERGLAQAVLNGALSPAALAGHLRDDTRFLEQLERDLLQVGVGAGGAVGRDPQGSR